jgi:hypothetical protein
MDKELKDIIRKSGMLEPWEMEFRQGKYSMISLITNEDSDWIGIYESWFN